MKYFVVIAMAAFALAGCGPRGEQIMIQNAQGTDYSQGYGDGCESGRYAAGVPETNTTRNQTKYRNSPPYRKGWKTGYKECKFREEKVAELSKKNIRASQL